MVLILKKIMKISLVILIVSSFIIAQNTQGNFMVSVGDQVKFKMLESEISVEFGNLADSFPGFLVNNTVIDVGTSFKVNVEVITLTELFWNTTIGSNTEFGTSPVAYPDSILSMFLAGQDSTFIFDLSGYYSSGVIPEKHLDLFYLEPFVDAAPITWTSFETLVTDQTTFLDLIFPYPYTSDATYNDDNNTMTIWWFYDLSVLLSPSPLLEISIINDVTFSYDMTTGVLQEVLLDFQYNGTYMDFEFMNEIDQHLIQTDQSDFVEFLDEYKWYFVGGGGGLIALILAFTIIARVRKR